MAICRMCHRPVPNGVDFCDDCKVKMMNQADESYLDSLLSSVSGNSANKKKKEAEETVAEAPVAEVPVTDAPVAEVPVIDIPETEMPVIDIPVIDVPETEVTVTENSVADDSIAMEPVTEEYVTEEQAIEESVIDGYISDEPVIDESVVNEEPIADVSFSDEPIADVSFTDEPIADASFGDEPITDASFGDEPITDASFGDEPITDASFAEEQVADASFTEEPIIESSFTEEPISDSSFTDKSIADASFTDNSYADGPIPDNGVFSGEEIPAENNTPVDELSELLSGNEEITPSSDISIDDLLASLSDGIPAEELALSDKDIATDKPEDEYDFSANALNDIDNNNINNEIPDTGIGDFMIDESEYPDDITDALDMKLDEPSLDFDELGSDPGYIPSIEDFEDNPGAEQSDGSELQSEYGDIQPIIDGIESEIMDETIHEAGDEAVEPFAEETIGTELPAEESIIEEPFTEESIGEEIPSEESIAEEPFTEETLDEELPSDEFIPEEQFSDEAGIEKTQLDESISDEPISDEPVPEDISEAESIENAETEDTHPDMSDIAAEEQPDIPDIAAEEQPDNASAAYEGNEDMDELLSSLLADMDEAKKNEEPAEAPIEADDIESLFNTAESMITTDTEENPDGNEENPESDLFTDAGQSGDIDAILDESGLENTLDGQDQSSEEDSNDNGIDGIDIGISAGDISIGEPDNPSENTDGPIVSEDIDALFSEVTPDSQGDVFLNEEDLENSLNPENEGNIDDLITEIDTGGFEERIKNLSSADEEGKKSKKEKKKNWFMRLFGNIKEDLTPEQIQERQEKAKAEEEAKKKAAEDKKKRAELSKEEKEAKKAEAKAAAAEAAQKKAEEKKRKAAEAKEKAKKKKEERLAIEEFEADEGRINKAGATVLFVIFAAMTIFIIVGTNIYSYNLSIKNAQEDFEVKLYNEAYYEVYGLKVKDEDIELYDKIMTVQYVNSELNSYEYYLITNNREKALDSLLKGLQRYDKYYELASRLGITDDLAYVKSKILEKLSSEFKMTEKEAYDMLSIRDDFDYSEYLYSLLGTYDIELIP